MTALNPVDTAFQTLKANKKKAFIPFVTAGDPDLETTARLINVLANQGASVIEVGFPYSDPIADGSVIQASYTRALNKGLRLADIFQMLSKLSADPAFRERNVPLVSMISYSLVHHRGAERFLDESLRVGLSGAIVPDLPVEEGKHLAKLARERNFKLIQLVTPTTPKERAKEIAATSSGFLYCVSIVGITGERRDLPPELLDQLRWLRTQTDLPLCVGFGISRPEQLQMLRDVADAVIVGSALVRRWEQTKPADAILSEVGEYVASMVKALNAS